MIAEIVKTDPTPISRLAPDTPAKLEEIIVKALEKDRDDRYQTIKDLLVDLRRLKKRLDFESEADRSTTPDQPETASTVAPENSPTASMDSARPTNSAEYIVSEIKRHRTGVLLGIIAAVPLLSGLIIFIGTRFSPSEKPAAPAAMKITKLTSGGRVNGFPIDGSTSISPDGKYVVFTLDEAGKVSMWMRQISTGSDVQILPAGDLRNAGTTISNDGEFVYFVGGTRGSGGGALYQIPILGGTPRKVLDRVRSPVSFSPDGSQFAFVRENEQQEMMLMIANADGSSERLLATRKGNDWFAPEGPAWSPDGKWIACGAGTDTGGSYMTVLGYSVTDGTERALTSQKWQGPVRRVLWLKDGSGIVVPVQESGLGTQLWFISQPEGELRRITNDLNGYGSASLGVSGDSKTIVTVQSKPSYQVWTTRLNETSAPPVQITHGETDGFGGLDWTPDDKIVFFTQTGENAELMSVKTDGTGARRLLTDSEGGRLPESPSVSPDGKAVYFTSFRSGTPHIWRVNTDNTDLKQITFGDFADFASDISPDGKWLLFSSLRSGLQLLWKMPVEGGEPVQVTDKTTIFGVFSPDGKFIATLQFFAGASPAWQIAIIPTDHAGTVRMIPPPAQLGRRSSIAWASDNRSVIVDLEAGGIGNLWNVPIDGSKPQRITNFTSDAIANFALSPDGKRVALSRGYSDLDVVLIKGFR